MPAVFVLKYFLITYNSQPDLVALNKRHVGRECRHPVYKHVSIPFIHPFVAILVAWTSAQIRLERICVDPKGIGQDSPM